MKLPQYRLLKISSDRKGTSIKAEWVDFVTCRECKWFDNGKNDSEIWSMCTRHFGKYIDVNADDFCSYGERNCSEKPNNSERLQACIDCEHTDMCEWCHTRWSKTEPQTYITEDRDTQVLDAWQVKQMQTERSSE